MGTQIHAHHLTLADYGGPHLENCNEHLNKTRPDVILDIYRAYLAAGADIVSTNSFNGTRSDLVDFGIADQTHDLLVSAARLARQAADEFSTSAKPRFVSGSMGPTRKAITVTGGITFPELRDEYYEQAKALVEGGVDLLMVETIQDTRNAKAALLGIRRLERELGRRLPVVISCTIETTGTMLAGQTIDAFWVSVAHFEPLAVGLNCATGPEFMTDHLRTLTQMAWTPVSCYPNAGLPNPDTGQFPETPESLAAQLNRFVSWGWLNLVGGCCGTTPAHIRAIAEMVSGRPPRVVPPRSRRSFYAGIELVEAEDAARPLLVGERTNVIGSRLFKNLVAEEKWEEATDIARRQVRNGAHLVDVCLQSTDRDELPDIPSFYEKLIRKIKAPLVIDTTDPRAVELALTFCQGKSLINSINLEDGEEKFERVCPLARAYGAAVVVGCIDEDKVQAQAFTRERKLAIAERSYGLLTEKYGLPPEDIVFDPLVFPCATGDANYVGGAVETVEGIRLIRERLPHAKTILGVSNVSFGLPPAAREVVNSVFLYHATKAGLDLAIVNTEKLERFASIPEQERRLAENVLFETQDYQRHIAEITDYFRKAGARTKAKAADLPLDQRLANYIIEGSKDGLIDDLNRKLAEGVAPLAVINGPLMDGMNEVGRLFNNNELIVAEVLQSAEAMKAAVAHLEQFMEKSAATSRGKVILATVKGDVHDIGKNLVEIILANNGYQVVNLGIKVPPQVLIEAYHQHQPDAIGLSGLLVKSAQQMVITAGDLREAGIRIPLLVGGAALSDKFTRTRIAPAYGEPAIYCKDAMTGLQVMNQLSDPAFLSCHAATEPLLAASLSRDRQGADSSARSPKVRTDLPVPPIPYRDRRVRTLPNLSEIWSYINPYMLYGRHLGFKGNFEKALADRDPQALSLYHQLEDLKAKAAEFLRVRAVWQFFEAERDGNSIHLFAPGATTPAHTFHFNRQPREDGLCLSDYLLEPRDSLALFVTTAGEGIRARAEEAKGDGRYFEAHALQALAIETAEGAAEYLHRRLREEWGLPDPPDLTMQQRFTSRYRGKRYSPGYPACPNLDDQQGIWKLLRPEEIGVQLTDGMMMDPEASVSALVFHHPDCAYFTAGEAVEPVPAG
jgi:5-methyltetrahydrofolate--homocysteine methyltransferase